MLKLLVMNAALWYNKICKAKQHLNVAISKSVEAVYKKSSFHSLIIICIHCRIASTFPDFIDYKYSHQNHISMLQI